MYFQPVVKADKKKSKINSCSCSDAHTKVSEKVIEPKFPSWKIGVFMQEPDVAYISKEGAVNFESKKLEKKETVFKVCFKLYVTKAVRKLSKIIC